MTGNEHGIAALWGPELARSLADSFDAGRARALVAELAGERFFGRPTGSPGGAMAAAHLVTTFASLGLAVSTQRFDAVDVPSFTATPVLHVAWPGETKTFEHRIDFAEHPRSALAPQVLTGRAAASRDADATGSWIILDAVPQHNGLARLAHDVAEHGAIGLLTPQIPDADGFLAKRLLGGPIVELPIVAVRQDLLRSLDGAVVTANAPVARTTVAGVNVLAEIPGSDPALADEPVLLTAHFDGVGADPGRHFPAAGDNASGVAVLAEIARVLSGSDWQCARPIRFAVLDAEEVGAQGSRAHAKGLLAEGIRPLVLNVDMAGRHHGAVSAELGAGSDALREALDHAGRLLGITLIAATVASDNRSYAAAGFPAVGLGLGAAHYHSPRDAAEHVEPEALGHAGQLLLVALTRLASSRVARPQGGN